MKDLEDLLQVFGNQPQKNYLKMITKLLSFLLIRKRYIHIKVMEVQFGVIINMDHALDLALLLEFMVIH